MDLVTWIILAHLLMLPFCVKGMLKKRKELNQTTSSRSNLSNGVQDLHFQMENLMEQNRQLKQEINSLNINNSKSEPSSNVYRIK